MVEDDESYRDVVSLRLRREGYEVELAADGTEGLRLFTDHPPDIVLLDVMLPGVSGHDVFRRMQALMPSVPIIAVTALGAEMDVVVGLELGAADYVEKPFHMRELIARMEAVLRRFRGQEPPSGLSRSLQRSEDAPEATMISVGPMTVDRTRREVRVAGNRVDLSRLEFDLLVVLLSPAGRVRKRDELMDTLWTNKDLADTRTLDSHIKRLRSKIEVDPSHPHHLITVRGVGFRFDAD